MRVIDNQSELWVARVDMQPNHWPRYLRSIYAELSVTTSLVVSTGGEQI